MSAGNEHVRLVEFHAILCERMGSLALATLDTWTRPAYLKKHERMRELMPEPMRMAVGRGYHWRRDECEAFADSLLASMRPARPAVRAD